MNILKKIYLNKWFPRFFYKKYDGGKNSGVTGYFLIEWKKVFSIGLLKFNEGSREAFHSHAFNAITFWLKGAVLECKLIGEMNYFGPSFKPKFTKRNNFHKVIAYKNTYALTFRGPWKDTWQEFRPNEENPFVTLTHGRKEVIE